MRKRSFNSTTIKRKLKPIKANGDHNHQQTELSDSDDKPTISAKLKHKGGKRSPIDRNYNELTSPGLI